MCLVLFSMFKFNICCIQSCNAADRTTLEIQEMFSSFSVSLFSYIGVAVGTYIGVAVGTYVYLLAAMSFGQALTLPSFSALVGQDCHLLRRGIRTLA